MKKILFVLIAIGVVLGIGYALNLYFKPHPDLSQQAADFSMNSAQLFKAFESDEAAANDQYLNALVEVSGKVKELSKTTDGGITLVLGEESEMFGVSCGFLPEEVKAMPELSQGDEVTIKGVCTGMLMDVNLSRCVLVP